MYNGFGLLAAGGIPKPALNVFRLLHKLGDRRIAVRSESVLATKSDGGVVVALWDYAAPVGTGATYTMPHGDGGSPRSFDLRFEHVPVNAPMEIWRVDETHGNVLKAFDAMGRPDGSLTQDQVTKLKAAGAMAPVEHATLSGGRLQVTVPAHGLAVLVIGR